MNRVVRFWRALRQPKVQVLKEASIVLIDRRGPYFVTHRGLYELPVVKPLIGGKHDRH